MAWTDRARDAAAEARRRHSGKGGIDPNKAYSYKQANRLFARAGRPTEGFVLHRVIGKSGAILKDKYHIRRGSKA